MDKEYFQGVFEYVIKRAKLKGHLDAQDARHLISSGIPIYKICIENVTLSDVENGFNEWIKSLQSMNKLITRILDVILNRCQKCHKPLALIRDWSGGVEGYGLYYCSDCDDIKEQNL